MSESALKRLAHVHAHLEKGFTEESLRSASSNVEHGTGSPKNSALRLSSHALAKAVEAWFSKRDLSSMRQWCYVGGKLQGLAYECTTDTSGPAGRTLSLLMPLLSNNMPLINWYAHYDAIYDLKRVEDHRTHDFFAYQAIVALRGEWSRLADRCERVLANPPGASREKKYFGDHKFYLALARRDMSAMEEALATIVTPRAIKARSNDESGFTDDLISTWAVVYAKIAWLHGLRVRVDSPFIPSEWLSTSPLSNYENHYPFFK
jgi:hypothetical protein